MFSLDKQPIIAKHQKLTKALHITKTFLANKNTTLFRCSVCNNALVRRPFVLFCFDEHSYRLRNPYSPQFICICRAMWHIHIDTMLLLTSTWTRPSAKRARAHTQTLLLPSYAWSIVYSFCCALNGCEYRLYSRALHIVIISNIVAVVILISYDGCAKLFQVQCNQWPTIHIEWLGTKISKASFL